MSSTHCSLHRIIAAVLCLSIFLTVSVPPTLAAVIYEYDANGNMTSDGQYRYTYNDANQLSKVRKYADNQLVSEYVYDHEGRRILKKEYENGTLKHTVYAPEKEFETKKLADNSTQNTTYYFANDELVAKKNPDGSKNYVHTDHLGSASVITDQSGAQIEETSYYPYGDIRAGGTKSKYLYTGQEKDLETGLNYYGARYYSSDIRRFTQPDTILPDPYDPQQLNRYSYVRNNPLKYTDPSGHFLQEVMKRFLQHSLLVASFPDAQEDMRNVSQSVGEFSASPGIATGMGAAVDLISLGLPRLSFGPQGRLAGKTAGAAIENQGKNIANAVADSIAKYGIKPYDELKAQTKGTGLTVHHLQEQRLANQLQQNTGKMLSIVLDTKTHQYFTNSWRTEIGYNNSSNILTTSTATKEQITSATLKIYNNYPDILRTLGFKK